ncbi:probable cytochrome P450 4aa1 isoform X2 [Prorops nasuta]|uniref:probable cytochrome P450 4aa1 isoform X2 n=1 Tax=Prorops nasuta TaxID=863751 RepID=UPI0034CF532A
MWDQGPEELWVYLILLCSIFIFYIIWDYLRCVRLALSLEGPRAIPFLGNIQDVTKDNLVERLNGEALSYGPIFRLWITIIPYVIVLEPADIKTILGSSKHNEKISFYKLLDNFLGKGLITKDVETWRIHRKILQPAFHIQILERFIKNFNGCADRLVKKLSLKDHESINITTYLNDSIYDILSETVLGLSSTDSDIKKDLPFRKGELMVLQRVSQPWLLIDWIYSWTKAGKEEQKQRKNLHDTCCKMMEERRELIRRKGPSINSEDDPCNNMSLLEYMVEVNEKNPYFTDEDIIEECCTFMLAGQDSVGTASAMTLFLLAKHQNWQNKCKQEINAILEDHSKSPSIRDFREMKILEMCIKEAMRLYPSVPFFARTLGEDVKLGKHIVPAGCGVFIVPYTTHRMSKHFSEPDSFKPERFNPENNEKRHPYSYLPFSAGPRNCIGHKFAMLEMKALISAILRRFRLETITGKEDIKPKFRLTVRAQGGLWVRLIDETTHTNS